MAKQSWALATMGWNGRLTARKYPHPFIPIALTLRFICFLYKRWSPPLTGRAAGRMEGRTPGRTAGREEFPHHPKVQSP